jgi:YHS domain-containing protein
MDKQTDPVCGMQIEKTDAAGQSDYEGRTFYFCSSACKEQFDANPTRFTDKSEI